MASYRREGEAPAQRVHVLVVREDPGGSTILCDDFLVFFIILRIKLTQLRCNIIPHTL